MAISKPVPNHLKRGLTVVYGKTVKLAAVGVSDLASFRCVFSEGVIYFGAARSLDFAKAYENGRQIEFCIALRQFAPT